MGQQERCHMWLELKGNAHCRLEALRLKMFLSTYVEFTLSWWHCVENASTNRKKGIFIVTILAISAQRNLKNFLGKVVW